ncbi:HNH endonuclease family protein [Natrinema halophilum]|uniref:HNH endonuclease family protein n=1 Tax=Natrinema halophilum TaxID=1699371 RepID=UPI001C5298E4|nr:HNH endonuclease family protein [Natrinema halophilum]UHQ96010.1 HNH endonuclease family protein [Natrinema halophilum]
MNRYEDDSQFRRSLSAADLYSKASSQDLRYLFYFYNEHRADEKGERGGPTLSEAMSNEYTVEHIWPQSPDGLPIEDADEYSSPEARYDAYVHHLGNLTLASRSWNSKWGNAAFETKRDDGYVESKLWVQWDIQDNYDEWSVANIEDREKAIIEFVLEEWATPETRLGGVEEPADAIDRLTTEEQFVLKALRQNTGGAVRRVIHGDVCELSDSPFDDPNSNGTERNEVGSILSRLQNVGLAEQNKHTWSPTDEALSVEAPT